MELKNCLLRNYQRTPVFIHVPVLFEITVTLLNAQFFVFQKTKVGDHFLAEFGVSMNLFHKNWYRTVRVHCNVLMFVAM
jgi:predicted ABC-type sugar transport system permease subunit